jgi:hypothetical protein
MHTDSIHWRRIWLCDGISGMEHTAAELMACDECNIDEGKGANEMTDTSLLKNHLQEMISKHREERAHATARLDAADEALHLARRQLEDLASGNGAILHY